MFWRKWWRKRSSNGVFWALRLAAWAALLWTCSPAFAADRIQELQDHFDHETHGSGKVKALVKLGDAQFEAASKAEEAGDFSSVALTFEKYRDNVRTSFNLLTKQEPDADRHPGGYRQLEMLVRRGIREVNDMILIVPEAVRPPMQIVRQDLLEVDEALIRKLFPRRTKDPQKSPPPPEAKP